MSLACTEIISSNYLNITSIHQRTNRIYITYSTLKSISKPHYDSSLRLDWNNLAKYMPDGKGETGVRKKLLAHTCIA